MYVTYNIVDVTHSTSEVCMLHACVIRGWAEHVEYLLILGADPLRVALGLNALQFASLYCPAMLHMLQAHLYVVDHIYYYVNLLDITPYKISTLYIQYLHVDVLIVYLDAIIILHVVSMNE